MEEELGKTKDFENLDLIYKNSSCSCESKVCENCENLERKIHYLLKILDKLTTGKSNIEDVLASQNCVFGKAGLDFILKAKEMGFQNFFQLYQKNNRLKGRFNRLLHASIA